MRKITALTVAALLLSVPVFAQTAGPRGGTQGQAQSPQTAQHRFAGMAAIEKKVLSELNLTKDQTAKVKALDKERAEKIKALRATAKAGTTKPDRQAMRAEIQKIQKWYQDELKGILGSQKYTEYQEKMKAEIAKARQNAGGKAGAGIGGGQHGKNGG